MTEIDVSNLIHTDPNYDPQKAHEYYLRTRQLKGRNTSGAQPTKLPRVTSGRTAVPENKVGIQPVVGKQKSSKPNAKITTPEERKKQVEAKVEELKAKFEALRIALRELVKQAKERAGVTSPEETGNKEEPSKTPEKKTAKEKADAAEKAKEYYEKNKDKTPDEQVKDLLDKIQKIQEKIKSIRKDIAAADKKAAEEKAAADKKVVRAAPVKVIPGKAGKKGPGVAIKGASNNTQ